MCIICAINKGADIKEEEWDRCWDNNSDGGGYLYLIDNGTFVVRKSMDKDELKKQFKEDFPKHHKNSPFLLHFRIKSHGNKDIDNVHPFRVNEDVWMAHNGVLSINIDPKDGRSDTKTFVEDFLSSLPRNFLRNKGMAFLISKYIGSSRLAFLDKSGTFYIFNKSAGEENDGRWWSNSSYKTLKVSKPTGTATQYNYLNDDASYEGGAYHYGAYYPNRITPKANGKNDTIYVMKRCMYCGGFVTNEHWDNVSDMCHMCVDVARTFERDSKLSTFEAKRTLKQMAINHRKDREELLSCDPCTVVKQENEKNNDSPHVRLLPAPTIVETRGNNSNPPVTKESEEFNRKNQSIYGFSV